MFQIKISIVGAGAVGGFFGGLLQKAGHQVTFLARGKHLAAMKKNGLVIKQGDERLTVNAVFTDNLNDLSKSQLILFCVKSNDTKQLAKQLLPILNKNVKILTMQNGVDNEEVLSEIFGVDRVFSCATYIQSTIEEAGIIKQHGRVKLVIGEVDSWEREECSSIVSIFQEAGIDTKHGEKILENKWSKFLWNVTFNPLSAITKAKIGEILDDKDLRKTAESICSESIKVALELGVNLDYEKTIVNIFGNAEYARTHITSMLQDRLNGKTMEVESMCGYLVRKAEKLNMKIPTIQTLYSILNYINWKSKIQGANKEQ